MWPKIRLGKYNNRKTLYNGVLYDSKREAEHAQQLDLLKRSGQIESWERQIKYELNVNGEKICKHYIDFKVMHNGKLEPKSTIELQEVKGRETRDWKLKRKLLHALYLKQDAKLKYTVIK